ncbi:MAG: DUF805 domain-containing protein [Prevotella sp.]|nr:DUF805 domain-containing protein [Prevotella sp.]
MEYKARPKLTFREALQKAFTEPISYNRRRRVRRSEYWWCMLACAIYTAFFAGLRFLIEDVFGINTSGWFGVVVFTLLSIPPIGMFLMETYGRLHDTNRRDTWLMGILIPILFIILSFMLVYTHHPMLGAIGATVIILRIFPTAIALVFSAICLVFCLKDSDKDENDYGPSPKYYTY